MSKYYRIRKSRLDGMGDTIRDKTNKTTLFYPLEMIEEVRKMGAGAGITFGSVASGFVYRTESKPVVSTMETPDFKCSAVGELVPVPHGFANTEMSEPNFIPSVVGVLPFVHKGTARTIINSPDFSCSAVKTD